VFASADDEPVLIMTSGAHRVNLDQVRSGYGLDLHRASADFVRPTPASRSAASPPVGHPAPIRTLVDRAWLRTTRSGRPAASRMPCSR
jgi:prolyl-tRNA editing enzyme YbaK/EbsC (Cys-tRNA(Pro) deacylase)